MTFSVLRIVMWINLAMFTLEFGGRSRRALYRPCSRTRSTWDAFVYGFSLYVIGKGAVWQMRGAVLKGDIMAAFAVGIAVEVALKLARGVTPAGPDIVIGGRIAALSPCRRCPSCAV